VDRLAARYTRISDAWNRDQIRVLVASVATAATRNRALVDALIERELPRVSSHDSALLAECDAALDEIGAAVSRALGESASAHARGRLLSIALAMGLAACGGNAENTGQKRETGDASAGAGGSAASSTGGSIGIGGSTTGGIGGSGGTPIQDASNDGFIAVPSEAGCTELREAGNGVSVEAGDGGRCPDGTAPKNDPPWSGCNLGPADMAAAGPT
jgi:hypothetical protein